MKPFSKRIIREQPKIQSIQKVQTAYNTISKLDINIGCEITKK